MLLALSGTLEQVSCTLTSAPLLYAMLPLVIDAVIKEWNWTTSWLNWSSLKLRPQLHCILLLTGSPFFSTVWLVLGSTELEGSRD